MEHHQPDQDRPSQALADADIDAVVSFLRALSGEGYEDQPPRVFPK